MLEFDENKICRLNDTENVNGSSTGCQLLVDGSWTQDRLGKDR